MSDEPSNGDSEKSDKKLGDSRVPPRTALIWIALFISVPLLYLLQDRSDSRYEQLEHGEFLAAVESGLIEQAQIRYDPQSQLREISGKIKRPDQENPVPFKLKTRLSDEVEEMLLAKPGIKAFEPNTMLSNFIFGLLPFIFIALLIYFFLIRQIKMAGKGAMSFGKSKARLLNKERNRVTFKHVAGVDEAKEEVQELVEFLKDPKKFQKLGGRIPKGVLMVGAPGTGKTLLARAIAGEADATFFSISGSDFVEMFVGVGASRVRDMFEQARKNTPCLIFIDEIDAVGRSRGVGLGGGNDEREQTLNALLVEMDGFDTQEGIIIIAATNRPDVLDSALLRPGRFDRRITVSLPDVLGREAILKVHSKKVKLDPKADLQVTARGTPGYSGAELANLLNEAALLAARCNKKFVGMVELDEARDKVRWGRERRSMAMSDANKKLTAWHEAGHALVNIILEHTDPLHKVTIIPRGPALGVTMYLPKEDILNLGKKQLLANITVGLAGRIAEEVVSHDISTGAGGDIQQVTIWARAMVCQHGMSDKLGMVKYDEDEEMFLGRDMMRRKSYSEHTARTIDTEVKSIIDECYQNAKEIIEAHADKLEIIANSLLEYESLDGEQVKQIVKTGRFDPPAAIDAELPEDSVVVEPVNDKPVPPKLDAGLGDVAPAAI